MKMMRQRDAAWLIMAAVVAISGCHSRAGSPQASGAKASAVAPKIPYAVFETSMGRIVIRLFPDAAPKAVDNFISLATGKKKWTDPVSNQLTERPLYNGTRFFRVMPGFIIQGGSPADQKFGGPGYTFEDEFSPKRVFSKPGLVAMANAGPNSNGSQFFITLAPVPWLDNKHTIFGEVSEGLGVAEAISKVPRSEDGEDMPLQPVTLREIRVEYR